VVCARPEETASMVAINTAAKACMLTLKPDGDRNINLGLLRGLAVWYSRTFTKGG
jgi:hypothetical protein